MGKVYFGFGRPPTPYAERDCSFYFIPSMNMDVPGTVGTEKGPY